MGPSVVHVQDIISGFNLTSTATDDYLLAEQTSPFNLSVTSGSDVAYFIDWNDGVNQTMVNPTRDASTEAFPVDHVYAWSGDYSINSTASNRISVSLCDYSTIVYDRVKNLQLLGNTTLTWPPALGSWQVVHGNDFIIFLNVSCKWNFQNVSDVIVSHISVLNTSSFIQVNRSFDRTDVGLQVLAVNCSDGRTYQQMTLYVDVTLYNDFLRNLSTIPGPGELLYWNNSVTFVLAITTLLDGVCIEWDMGDGTPHFVFSRPNDTCSNRTFYPATVVSRAIAGPNYDSIDLAYVYADFGRYTATVRAFYYDAEEVMTANVTVTEWPCSVPNVSIDSVYTDPSAPYETLVSKGFVVKCNASVDCMKSSNRVLIQWSLYNVSSSPQGVVFVKSADGPDSFDIPPFYLRRGRYRVNVSVTPASDYFDLVNFTKTVICDVIVNPTPLAVGFDESPYIQVPSNLNMTLRSFNATFDPDLQDIKNKDGMTWTWSCKRSYEEWPSTLNEVPYRPFNKSDLSRTGCFGDGPGILQSFTNKSAIEMMGSYFEEFANYTIQLAVSKDTRNASSEMTVEILPYLDALNISTRCVLNCAERILVKDSTQLYADCVDDYCFDEIERIVYYWEIYDDGGQLLENLSSKAEDQLINGYSLRLKPHAFISGHTYVVKTYASIDHSFIAISDWRGIANIPPFGDSCSIDPSNGTAAETEFKICCNGWKNGDGSTGQLVYRFLMSVDCNSSSCADDLVTIYYNSSDCTDRIFLSIGNASDNFSTEISAQVMDRFNDFRPSTKFDAQVSPPGFSSPLNYLENYNFGKLTPGSEASVVANIIAFTSVINTFHVESNEDDDLLFDWERDIKDSSISLYSRDLDTFSVPLVDPPSSQSELLQKLTEVREKLLCTISRMSNCSSLVAISQRLSAIAGLMRFPQQITAAGVDSVGTTLNLMLDVLSKQKTPLKEQLMSVRDLMTTTVSMGIVSNVIASKSSVYGGEPGETASATYGVAQRLSDVLRNLRLEQKNGDAPIKIAAHGKVYLRIANEDISATRNSTFASEFGKIFVSAVNSSDSCLQSSTFHTARNIFMTNGSETLPRSPFLSLILTPCQDGRRKSPRRRGKRSAEYEDRALSAQMDITVAARPSRGSYVDNETQDAFGMIIHTYNLSQLKTFPIFIKVTPITQRNDTLVVYIKSGSRPTPQNYDWILMTHNGTNNYSASLRANATNTSQLFVGVQSSAGCFNVSLCVDAVKIRLQYYINLQEASCHRWADDEKKWEVGSCEVNEVKPNKVVFKSHLLGGFGVGFVTPVNLIDFNRVFIDFGKKFLSNPCVWATVVTIIVLYILFAVIARRLDKKDALKWRILPLVDNFDEDIHEYEIHVHTGFLRNSGTKSNVFFKINGTLSETGVRRMEDGIRQNFGRGEISSFAMKTPNAIGTPLKCQIWHDNSGGKNAAGWFLGKIVLVDVKTGDWYMFLCNEWLAIDENGENQTKRSLTVSRSYVVSETGELVRRNITTGLVNDHLWFSVGYQRKTRSLFTRAQRLGACLATLFLAMITSIMFYKSAGETGSGDAIHIGIISISGTQFYISFISSLIVFPPILIITIIFSKSKPTSSECHDTGRRKRMSVGVGKLPHACVYVAWVLVFLAVLASAFFTVLYSIQWGSEKSKSWLMSFILSFIESAILIQPVKVILIAILVSFVLKRDPEVCGYETQLGKMKTLSQKDEETLLLIADSSLDDDLSAKQSAAAIRQREMDNKMKTMISEIIFYLFFLFFILLVINGQQNSSSFIQNQNLAYILTDVALNNNTVVGMGLWAWVQETLIPVIYPTQHYNGWPVATDDRNYLSDMSSWRIGPPRLRQLRLKKERCKHIPYLFRKARCTNSYSSSTEDKDSYKPGWISVANLSYFIETKTNHLDSSFVYRTSEELDGEPFEGYMASYSGGGYVANLGLTYESATDIIRNLSAMRWVDVYSRAVMVEFSVFNPGSRLANVVVVLFEYPSTGQIMWSRRVETVQLYRYTGSNGVIALVSEVACAIFVLVITVLELRKICRSRMAYFRSFWNCIQSLTLVLFFVAVGLYAVRCLWTMKVVEKMMNHRGELVSFNQVIKFSNWYLLVMGFVAFLTQCQLLHLLRYNQTISVLGQTLYRSASTLLDFGVMSSVVFFAFAVGAHLLFFQLQPYSTMYECSLSLVAAFLGKFNFSQLVDYYGNAAGYYLLIYLLVMILIITNILISLINDYLSTVSNDPSSLPRDHEVIDHFFSAVKSIVIGKPQTKTTAGKKNSQKNIQDLSNRIRYLDDVAQTMMKSSWNLEKIDLVLLFVVMYQKQKDKKRMGKLFSETQ